jgi:flavin-dependent dehydrogenase
VRAGAQVRRETAVREVLRLADGDVAVALDDGRPLAARYLIDASGQATLVGRHLGLREVVPGHRKVAYFGHFRGVDRLPGDEEGHPSIVMMADGWFWLIAIDPYRTSIGLVMDAEHARRAGREQGVPPAQMLGWGIARCPFVAARTRDADFPADNHVGADFSYRCRPYAGPGYFLVGDAATFLDPIFSTGLCLAMVGAARAADAVRGILAGAAAAPLRADYERFVAAGTEVFFRLVRRYYEPAFRELMIEGEGPLAVHRALFSVLAGHVFPRPSFALRWRLWLMELLTEVQARIPLAPRRRLVYLWPPPPAGAPGEAGVSPR